jgi:hypothetical protein
MCRKSHGTAFATYVECATDHFRWRRGQEHIDEYESSPGFERPFCRLCGSVVAGGSDDDTVAMPAGNLDDDPGVRPSLHIFVAHKAPWYEIVDALRRFDAYPEDWESAVVAGPALTTPSSPDRVRGSCMCGAVVYEISHMGGEGGIICCHCSRCRKARSAAHGTNCFVPAADFQWIAGEDRVVRYKVPDAAVFTNAFCATCGSIVPPGTAGRERVPIPAGTLDADPGARPRIHIFAADRAPWFEIADDLPRFDQSAGG